MHLVSLPAKCSAFRWVAHLADGEFYHSPHFVGGEAEAEKGPGHWDLLAPNPAVFATAPTPTTCGDSPPSPLLGFIPFFPSPTIAAGKNVQARLWAQSKWPRAELLQKQTRKEPGAAGSKRGPSHRVVRHTPRARGLAETGVVGRSWSRGVRVGDGQTVRRDPRGKNSKYSAPFISTILFDLTAHCEGVHFGPILQTRKQRPVKMKMKTFTELGFEPAL